MGDKFYASLKVCSQYLLPPHEEQQQRPQDILEQIGKWWEGTVELWCKLKFVKIFQYLPLSPLYRKQSLLSMFYSLMSLERLWHRSNFKLWHWEKRLSTSTFNSKNFPRVPVGGRGLNPSYLASTASSLFLRTPRSLTLVLSHAWVDLFLWSKNSHLCFTDSKEFYSKHNTGMMWDIGGSDFKGFTTN